jgi:hypothetical protein
MISTARLCSLWIRYGTTTGVEPGFIFGGRNDGIAVILDPSFNGNWSELTLHHPPKTVDAICLISSMFVCSKILTGASGRVPKILTGPGPERNKVLEEFCSTAYSKYPRKQRELLRSRGKVLAEYIGILDEERLGRSLCERSPGPSHVEDGCGDAQRSDTGLHGLSAVIDGPSSLRSSVVGTESTPSLGLTDTRAGCGRLPKPRS